MKTDQDQLVRMRYMAIMSRRSSPPRCNPISILVLVLSGGIIFIGLTMTVISNWPGSTSMGNNPLRIAGPVLLGFGSLAFFCGVVMACILNGKENKRWARKVNNYVIAASRQSLNHSTTSLKQDVQVQQSKESDIETKQGLMIETSDSQQYTSSTYTDEYQKGEGRYSLTRLQPAGAYSGGLMRANIPVGLEDFENDSDLPTPVRAMRKKKKDGGENSSLENLKALELLNPRSTTPDSSGFDEEVFSVGDSENAEVPLAIRKRKKKRNVGSKEKLNTMETEELLNISHDLREHQRGVEPKSEQPGSFSENGSRSQAAYYGKSTKPSAPAKPSTFDQRAPPSPGEAYRLRVQVKTQSGTSVHIHQGSATPPLTFSTFNPPSSGKTDL